MNAENQQDAVVPVNPPLSLKLTYQSWKLTLTHAIRHTQLMWLSRCVSGLHGSEPQRAQQSPHLAG